MVWRDIIKIETVQTNRYSLTMITKKEIDQEKTQVKVLAELSEVFGEIAAIRMRKIRDSVLKNRNFLSAIESIFRDSLAAYAGKLSELAKKGRIKEGGKVTFLAHNGKTVAVLISANTGFFGEVIKETFEMFLNDVRANDWEVTIIGKVGRSLFIASEPNRPYTYFELPDYGIDVAKLETAIRHLVQYEEIRVYFGKYQSVVTQKPTSFKISAGTPISGKTQAPAVKYIFEPSVEKILMFFETQIFASLFNQSLRESQLAKYASRILAMDSASQKIQKRVNELRLEGLKFSHRLENKKQLNSLAPIIHTNQ